MSTCFIVRAQQSNNTGGFSISGHITDSITHQPVEYATITIINAATKKTVDGAITDKNGSFTINKLAEGQYQILIQCIGYTECSTAVTLNDALQLDHILLSKKISNLQSVTVTSTRQAIENKIDKIVFNVDKDITSQGGMATDALKKIPQVSVDINGNVELLGNPGILFLINGKPSGIFGNSPADALQAIPASEIQSIEVITSPTAKYDASGTGGIINIILKKNKVQGFNGSVNLAAGSRLENAGITASIKKTNFGVNAYFNGNLQLVSHTPVTSDRFSYTNNSSSRFMQQSESDFTRNGYKYGLGFDWSLSKNESFSGSIGFNHFANHNSGDYNQLSIQYDALGSITSTNRSIRFADTKVDVTTMDNEIAYKRKFARDNQELELFYNGSYSQNNTFYNQKQRYQNADTAYAGSTSLNPGKENETDFGVNYTHPITENIMVETGLKLGMESILSNADVLTLQGAGVLVKDGKQSFQSDFKRNVYAGYLSLSFPLQEWLDVKTGIRYEYTDNNATYSNSGKATIPAYKNLAPSIIMQHKMNKGQSIKLAYSYRLERPDFRDLNPFYNLSDPHAVTTGNPNLQPEIGHMYELTYAKTYDKGGNINIVLYMQRNSPDIKPYTTYYSLYKIGDSTYQDLTITTRATIAAEVRAGVNIAASMPVTKRFSVRGNVMMFNRHLNNVYDTPAVINGFGVRSNLNLAYQFSKAMAGEIFGNYMSGMKWQGQRPPSFSYTIALRRQFKNTKGSIGIIAVNPFNRYINQKAVQQSKGFTTNTFQQLPYRSFGISFAYKFGKLKFSKPKDSDNYLYTPPGEGGN
ncbi:MAG: TonB-dependent receptor [Bacteroidetes bacterium]|nr:TonB-dependent receptor [Bacteroidota bacterium]